MKAAELLREPPSLPEAGDSALLLNPRLHGAWREKILSADLPDLHSHAWLASSGTGGRLKIIALSRTALEASACAVNEHLQADASDCWINPLPLFHVGGLGIMVRAMLVGSRCETMSQWDAAQYTLRARECGATLSALVPAQVHDIVRSALRCPPRLRAIVVGGGALDESLRAAAADLGWPLLPSYGLTEAASQVATASPDARSAPWLPLLGHVEARVEDDGVLSLRGPSLLTGWMIFSENGAARWEDPKSGGWFHTSDRCELRGEAIRMLGRVDDLLKIRGELVDVAALERDLQACVISGLVRIDAEPDDRNGARLHVIAENVAAETEAREALDIFPPCARPASFRIGSIPLSPLGKKIRGN